jgi:homoserine dehydrogenase
VVVERSVASSSRRLIADAAGRPVGGDGQQGALARRGAELESEARRTAHHSAEAPSAAASRSWSHGRRSAANTWTSISGIVNGTTNFILTAMTRAAGILDRPRRRPGRDYAEADPSGDVEGRGAADKLAILIRMAFGDWPDVAAIRLASPAVAGDGAPGIAGVTAEVISAAAELDRSSSSSPMPDGPPTGRRRGRGAGGHPGR